MSIMFSALCMGLVFAQSATITTVSATYGDNCRSKPGFQASKAAELNAQLTRRLKRRCDGKESCYFATSGTDVCLGCLKLTKVTFKCGSVIKTMSTVADGVMEELYLACASKAFGSKEGQSVSLTDAKDTDAAKCGPVDTWKFIKYEPSAYEQEWVKNIHTWKADPCKWSNSQVFRIVWEGGIRTEKDNNKKNTTKTGCCFPGG